MELLAGLVKLPDTTPATSVLISEPNLINGIWQGVGSNQEWMGGGYRAWVADDAYGADLGTSQRIAKIEMAGIATKSYGPCLGYFYVTPVVRIFVSEDNSYWTEKCESSGVLTSYGENSYFSWHTVEFSVPENVTVTGRYVKAVWKTVGQIQFSTGFSAGNVQEISVFGLEGEGEMDLPCFEGMLNYIPGECNLDLPLFDCFHIAGDAVLDLPFFDMTARGWIGCTTETDLPFFEIEAVGGSAVLDLPCFDSLTDHASVGRIAGSAVLDLPFFEAEAVPSEGDLPFFDVLAYGFIKGIGGSAVIDLPGFDSVVSGFVRGHAGDAVLDLPCFDSLSRHILIRGDCVLELPGFDGYTFTGEDPESPLTPPSPPSGILSAVRLEYCNVW